MLANWPWHSIPWWVRAPPKSFILQERSRETSTPSNGVTSKPRLFVVCPLVPAASCTGYVRRVTHDEIADAVG
jgi:hypothetical protein